MSEKHKTSIGGQALIEGVMMRGPKRSAMAVRQPDGEIFLETSDETSGEKPWYKRTPFIRGSFNFIDGLAVGYKYLMRSADIASAEEEGAEEDGFDKAIKKIFGDKSGDAVTTIAMVFAIALSVFLFMLLPTFISGFIRPFISSAIIMAFIESALKIGIFIVYLMLVSRSKDIQRVFAYHGAEHKTIACYEHGDELTPENARKYSRFHPRCGTSFILIVLVVSVLVLSMVSWNNIWMRIAIKILSLPVVVGLSYEIIRIAGKYDNALTRIISAPGMWLQRLTTVEPDDSQLEVAIAAMTPCIPDVEGLDEF